MNSEIELLRKQHGVRLVDEGDEGAGIAKVSPGVYGFSYTPHIECPLFQKQNSRSFEVHKLPDGSVEIIGFVSTKEVSTLSEESGYSEIKLFPELTDDAINVVSIALSRVIQAKGPARDDGNSLSIELRPANEAVN